MASSGAHRVQRGGGWNNNPRNVRAANRNHDAAANRNANLGFRLASTRHRPRVGFKDPAPAHKACPAGHHPVPALAGQRALHSPGVW
jgi:hypothetical protein